MSLVELLRTRKPALAATVVEAMYRDPFWSDRFAARGRVHSEQDLGFHVDYVIQAAEARDAGVMERYARWLQNVLTTRGMCTLHLADSFGRLATAINDPEASTYISAARTALLYDASAARTLQERIRHAITTGTPGTIEDTEYHLAYLADAIALGQPRVYVGHVTWLADFFKRTNRHVRALTSTLEALVRTLDDGESQAQTILAVALRELT